MYVRAWCFNQFFEGRNKKFAYYEFFIHIGISFSFPVFFFFQKLQKEQRHGCHLKMHGWAVSSFTIYSALIDFTLSECRNAIFGHACLSDVSERREIERLAFYTFQESGTRKPSVLRLFQSGFFLAKNAWISIFVYNGQTGTSWPVLTKSKNAREARNKAFERREWRSNKLRACILLSRYICSNKSSV